MTTASPPAVALESIASCFEGIIPASICTCSPDGTPNLTYLSIVHQVDSLHVGLSYQFFNKTRENLLQNPFAQVVVVSPTNLHQYRLDLRYERTETAGALFDRVRTRLDAVASQTGMSHIFRLRGVDIFQVLDCRPMNAQSSAEGFSRVDYLSQIEEFAARLAACNGLESIIDVTLDALSELFGYDYSFLMAPDEEGKRLFTLGSRGFGESGIGSEVWIGEGILGVAAERRQVVRTTNFSRDVLYSNAVRSRRGAPWRRQPAGTGDRLAWAAAFRKPARSTSGISGQTSRHTLPPERDSRAVSFRRRAGSPNRRTPVSCLYGPTGARREYQTASDLAPATDAATDAHFNGQALPGGRQHLYR
jgi:hypothetical protein